MSFNDLHEGIVGFDLVNDPDETRSAYEALRMRREKVSPGSTVGLELQEEWLAGDQALHARFHSAFSDGLAKAGVFSLSADPRSPPLWAYYGGDGAGVCVQLAVQEDPTLVLAQQVNYEQRKPSFDLMKALKNDGLADELMQHLSTKGSEWSHEREWRLLHGRAGDLVVLQPPAVLGLILGPRITEFGISKLRDFLEQRMKNGLTPVRTYSANPDPSRFPLKILSRRQS